MKPFFAAVLASISVLTLPGCLQVATTIQLNKDGSGKVIEETTLGAQMSAMMDQMAALGGEATKDPVAEMFSPIKGKAKALTYGEGVTFVSSEPLTIGANKGARMTYSFGDINKLKFLPGNALKDMAPPGAEIPAGADQLPIVFKYEGGKLAVTMPEPPKPSVPEAMPEEEENPQMDEMMKQMLGDMKMSLKIVADSGIAETTATHREGNVITLMEMNMAELLKNPETLKKLKAAPKNDPEAAMTVMRGLEGVKMETKKEVSVTLK